MNKMIKLACLALLAASSLHTNAQQAEEILMWIDDEPITKSEFLYIYEKNQQPQDSGKTSMREYLDLFVNFKLKVHEAEKLEMDTTAAFQKELSGYRRQAIAKYMTDSATIKQLERQGYDHLSKDRRAAHIAIECPMGSDAETEAAALAKIQEARIRVTTGLTKTVKKGKKMVEVQQPAEDFFAVADEVSTDPSVKDNHGELGWIIPFRYVWPFEKTVYDTPVGQVTEIFRSGYGFHIALVEEERDHTEAHASHIMKMVPPTATEDEAVKAEEEIRKIYEAVKSGADFAALASTVSDDKGSARNGGDLGWFAKGQMVKPFEDAAFALKEGELSEPVRSRYGWHVILKHGERGIRSFEEMQPEISKKVRMDERYQQVQQNFVARIRKEYNLPAEMSDAEVIAVEDSHLEAKHEDLRHLVKEYHDGILLFDISLREVWDKASQDTVGLTNYFAKNKKKYTWDASRYKGYIITAKTEAQAKAAKSIIRSAHKDSVQSYINQRINTDSIPNVVLRYGLWKRGDNAMVDKLQWKQGEWTPTEEYPIVFLSGKELKKPEDYIDIKSQIVSDYQDYLEKMWIEELKAKYPVKFNEEVVKSL